MVSPASVASGRSRFLHFTPSDRGLCEADQTDDNPSADEKQFLQMTHFNLLVCFHFAFPCGNGLNKYTIHLLRLGKASSRLVRKSNAAVTFRWTTGFSARARSGAG